MKRSVILVRLIILILVIDCKCFSFTCSFSFGKVRHCVQNWLKVLMQVRIDVKCMQTNFGG